MKSTKSWIHYSECQTYVPFVRPPMLSLAFECEDKRVRRLGITDKSRQCEYAAHSFIEISRKGRTRRTMCRSWSFQSSPFSKPIVNPEPPATDVIRLTLRAVRVVPMRTWEQLWDRAVLKRSSRTRVLIALSREEGVGSDAIKFFKGVCEFEDENEWDIGKSRGAFED